MPRLKVRLEDGSEVGPMDLDMVQTWFQQGLIAGDTPVQKEGAGRWMRLVEAVDLRNWQASAPASRGRRTARASGGPAAVPEETAASGRWRLVLAAVLLFASAVAAALLAIWPDRIRPEFDGVPWVQVALVLAALALLLVRGWSLGRRLVRAVSLCAAAAVFPAAGIFVARGMRGETLLALGACAVLGAGFFALLGPRPTRQSVAAGLLGLALGIAGLVRYAPAEPPAIDEAAASAWAQSERHFARPDDGFDLTLPPGWVALKPGNPFFSSLERAGGGTPANVNLTLAHPRVGGRAFFIAEPLPAGALVLEHYLDHVIAGRRAAAAGYEEGWRRDGRLGAVASRRASGRREGPEGAFAERVVVAQDADRVFALVAWAPEKGGGRALEELDALERATALSGVRGNARKSAVDGAFLELPHLTPASVTQLVAWGGPASPGTLFRRAALASALGVAALDPALVRERDGLTAAAVAPLTSRERAALGDYMRRVGSGEATLPDEDERMRATMKTVVLQLPAAQRSRLAELNARAIGSAVAGETR